jgi:hypothetical protein
MPQNQGWKVRDFIQKDQGHEQDDGPGLTRGGETVPVIVVDVDVDVNVVSCFLLFW